MADHGLDLRHVSAHQAEHQAEHQALLVEVTRRRSALDSLQGDEAMALHDFMVDWLKYHIMGVDQRRVQQLTAIAAGASPAAACGADPREHDPGTATLLAAMERLFRRVSKRNHELFELNQTLERRVAARTQPLSEANVLPEDVSMTDVLTGLPNRCFAMHRLQAAWAEALKNGTPMACIMLAADGFKGVNDAQGHDR